MLECARQKSGICGQPKGKHLTRFDQFYRCTTIATKATVHEEGRILQVGGGDLYGVERPLIEVFDRILSDCCNLVPLVCTYQK